MVDLFTLRVSVDRVRDHVPGTPEERALVVAYARVKIGGSGYLTPVSGSGASQYEATVPQGQVAVSVGIWRHTSHKLIHGSIRRIGQAWYWVSDGSTRRTRLDE